MAVKISPKSDNEVIYHIIKSIPSVDQIYRINTFDSVGVIKGHGTRGVNFVNVYNQTGMLIKQTIGDECEFNMIKFLRDSLDKNLFSSNNTVQLHYFKEIQTLAHIIYTQNDTDQSSRAHFLLMGYALFTQKIAGQKSRYRYLEHGLEDFTSKCGIIILDLDPS